MHACQNCFIEEDHANRFQRCGACRKASYCVSRKSLSDALCLIKLSGAERSVSKGALEVA